MINQPKSNPASDYRDFQSYETHINQAVAWLEAVKVKNGGVLLNGNFSKAGELYRVKVRDIRAEWEKLYPEKPPKVSTLERLRRRKAAK